MDYSVVVGAVNVGYTPSFSLFRSLGSAATHFHSSSVVSSALRLAEMGMAMT